MRRQIKKPVKAEWASYQIDKMPWDMCMKRYSAVDNCDYIVPYQVVKIYEDEGCDNPLCHCLGGRWGENNYYCYPLFREHYNTNGGDSKKLIDIDLTIEPEFETIIEWNGTAPAWGIELFENNHYKKGEIRGNVTCWITRNWQRFYNISGNSMQYCTAKAYKIIAELREHPISFNSRNWREEITNRKIWFYDDPAIVERVLSGSDLIIKPDKNWIDQFKIQPWMVGDDQWDDQWREDDSVKCDILDPNINWFRKDTKTERFLHFRTKGVNTKDLLKLINDLQNYNQLSYKAKLQIQKFLFKQV